MNTFHYVFGPYYCDKIGQWLTKEQLLNPNVIPFICFWWEDNRVEFNNDFTIVCSLDSSQYIKIDYNHFMSNINISDIPNWVLSTLKDRVPKLNDNMWVQEFVHIRYVKRTSKH